MSNSEHVPLEDRRIMRKQVLDAIRETQDGNYNDVFFKMCDMANGNTQHLQHQLKVLKRRGVVELLTPAEGEWRYQITSKHEYFPYLKA